VGADDCSQDCREDTGDKTSIAEGHWHRKYTCSEGSFEQVGKGVHVAGWREIEVRMVCSQSSEVEGSLEDFWAEICLEFEEFLSEFHRKSTNKPQKSPKFDQNPSNNQKPKKI
jgi:hypothetical protein